MIMRGRGWVCLSSSQQMEARRAKRVRRSVLSPMVDDGVLVESIRLVLVY